MIFKYLDTRNITKINELFGSWDVFTKKKIIHCVSLYLKDYEKFDWFFINKPENFSSPPEDNFSFTYLRSLCDGIINSVINLFH